MKKFCIRLITFSVLFVLMTGTAQALGINIDGYYDDWENVPKTKISKPNPKNKHIHWGAMLKDDTYIYVYYRMSDTAKQKIPTGNMEFYVSGKRFVINIYKLSNSGTIRDKFIVKEKEPGTYTNLAPTQQNEPRTAMGYAAITVAKNKQIPNDQMEFAVRISDLEEYMNLEPGTINSGAEVSLYNPELGRNHMTIIGVSSGPYIGALLGLSTIFAGRIIVKKRNRKVIS